MLLVTTGSRSIRTVAAATWYCARAIAAVASSACAAGPGSARNPVKKHGCTAGPASVTPPEVASESTPQESPEASSRGSACLSSPEGAAYRYR